MYSHDKTETRDVTTMTKLKASLKTGLIDTFRGTINARIDIYMILGFAVALGMTGIVYMMYHHSDPVPMDDLRLIMEGTGYMIVGLWVFPVFLGLVYAGALAVGRRWPKWGYTPADYVTREEHEEALESAIERVRVQARDEVLAELEDDDGSESE